MRHRVFLSLRPVSRIQLRLMFPVVLWSSTLVQWCFKQAQPLTMMPIQNTAGSSAHCSKFHPDWCLIRENQRKCE